MAQAVDRLGCLCYMSESRQANPIAEIPLGADKDIGNSLWTPDGLEHVQSWRVASEDRGIGRAHMIKHEFRFTFKGEIRYFGVLAPEDESPAAIDEMVGNMVLREARRIIEALQARGSKLVPEDVATNIPIRRELAAVMRDYIKHARKRAQTTTGRVYQPAVAIP